MICLYNFALYLKLMPKQITAMEALIPTIMVEDSKTFLEDFWMIAVCAETSLYTLSPLSADAPTFDSQYIALFQNKIK